jgi:quercetin dioxygenase-like cupin family protein
MQITRIDARPSAKGPEQTFTGSVRIDPLFQAPEPAGGFGAAVIFEPGAPTLWHTHPLGQTLIVTSGVGLVAIAGGDIQRIRAGDVVWCPPGEKQWHGATTTTAMTHIALVEQLNGRAVDWLEHVADDEYGAANDAAGR